MSGSRLMMAVGFVLLLTAAAAGGLASITDEGSAHAAPAMRHLSQGVQASGYITLGGGTCMPDAVLTDCDGNVTEQLKGPGGAGFFAPYIGKWVDLNGARQTCPAGDTYIDVVTIQPATNPCHTPTPGGPTATPTVQATATPGGLVDVEARDNVFVPATVNVAVGTTVRWRNVGLNAHTTTADGGLWDSGTMNPGDSYSFTFNTPGTYPYHCSFHRALGMTGTIVVGTVPMATPTATVPVSGTNLALGKTVQVSSVQPIGPANGAVDGDPATFWASVAGYDPYAAARNVQWIYVDLGASYAVKSMHMTWGHWRHARTYAIYAWMDYCDGWCIVASTRYGDGDDTATFPEEVEARYWMLWLVNPYLIGGHYELTEWEVFGSPTAPIQTTNVAAGKPAVALNHTPPNEARLATDADLATEWRSLNLPVWIYVDLMATEEVDRAILRWTPGAHATHYTMYAWNGWTWTPIYGKSNGAGGDETAVFPAVRTRWILLHATAGPAGTVGLREFEIYRRKTSGLPTPLHDGDWREIRAAGWPDVVPEGVRRPQSRLELAEALGPTLDRSRLPNPSSSAVR